MFFIKIYSPSPLLIFILVKHLPERSVLDPKIKSDRLLKLFPQNNAKNIGNFVKVKQKSAGFRVGLHFCLGSIRIWKKFWGLGQQKSLI